MEGVLERADRRENRESVSLYELLPVEAIALPLPCRTRGSVIQEMVKLAARTGLLWDAAKMTEAVRVREELHPTALDNGVALLHPRRPLASILAEPLLALGRTTQGIPFGGRGGALTDVFFLHLFHRGPRASADSGPAQPVDRRQCLHDRIEEPAGAGGGPSIDPPHRRRDD